MKKNVQIPYMMFIDLVKYHLLDAREYEAKIKTELNKKLEALSMHDLYQKYKTASTEEEREKARQKYLDRKGVPESFRW